VTVKLQVLKELEALVLKHLDLEESYSASKSENGRQVLRVPPHVKYNFVIWVHLSGLFILGAVKVLINCVLATLDRKRLVRRYEVQNWLHGQVLDDLLNVFVNLELVIDYLNWPNLCNSCAQGRVGGVVIKTAKVALESTDVEVADADVV
jgi:hypothetical protein